MKKLFVAWFFIGVMSMLKAQILWNQAEVVSQGTPVPESFALFNGQVVVSGLYFFESSVAGSTLPSAQDGNSKAFISSLDEDYDLLWKHNLSATGSITQSTLEVVSPTELVWLINFSGSITIDQNHYVSHGGKDVLALFINELGVLVKVHHMGTPASDDLSHVYVNQHSLHLLLSKPLRGDSLYIDGQGVNYGNADFWNISLNKSDHLPFSEPIDLNGEEEDISVFDVGDYAVIAGTSEKTITGHQNEHHAFIRKVGSTGVAWEIMETKGQYSMMSAAEQMGNTTVVFGGYVDSLTWQNNTLVTEYMHAHFLAGVNAKGELLTLQSIEGMVSKSKIDVHSNGDLYLSGQFSDSLKFDANHVFYSENPTFFIAQYNSEFQLQFVQVCASSDAAYIIGVESDDEGHLWTVGQNQGELTLGNQLLNTAVKNIFIANNKGPGVPNSSQEMIESEVLNVYPNPIQNQLPLNIQSSQEIKSVVIFNMNGQLVTQLNAIHALSTQLDTSFLQAGMYTIWVQMTDGSHHTQKMISLN